MLGCFIPTPTDVNFINVIFRTIFFDKAKTQLEKRRSYEKFIHKTLMKLKPDGRDESEYMQVEFV